MNEKQVKKLNVTLTKKSPGTLIDGLEHFVAVLRNHKAATNVDVELYFQDFSRLILKLQRIDATQLHNDVVLHHKNAFVSIKPAFNDEKHADYKINSPFAAFVNWGI